MLIKYHDADIGDPPLIRVNGPGYIAVAIHGYAAHHFMIFFVDIGLSARTYSQKPQYQYVMV